MKKRGGISQQCIAPMARVLAWSQKYMRDRQASYTLIDLSILMCQLYNYVICLLFRMSAAL